MQRLTQPNTQPFSVRTEKPHTTLTAKLEIARLEISRALFEVQAVEGRFLDYGTSDTIACALLVASRELKELTLAVAVLERKVS